MKFINETSVESVLLDLEEGKLIIEDVLKDFEVKQIAFIQFISSENFKLLTETEFDLLLFNLLVLYRSIQLEQELESLDAKIIERHDEENWEAYNEEGSKNFGKVIDGFFKDYPQEDLLAFVEDSLATEKEDDISQVGKEIIFISCKTFIDTCHSPN